MTLKITINMDNAVFEGEREEVWSILHWLGKRLAGRDDTVPDEGPIMDSNGNTVGQWSVTL